ncbi:secreted RxLR effector protein 161-like [Miscanthus floridulus]|uniref:secreted RxLR effector protein 161-like n=1 Tax=Miscanthus floridulus TaxID=154761 RepID=UPI003459B9CF
MEQHIKLLPGKPELVANATKYRSIVGSLRYLVNSRPNLAFSVGMVSRFMETLNLEHCGAIKRIVKYVAGTTELGCKFVKGQSSELFGFTNSDHAGDIEKRKSTTGVVFFLGGNIVTWSSQKQRVVSLSSCESEYIAGATGACQGVWLSRLLADLTCSEVKKFKLFIDNRFAQELSKNPSVP